MPLMGISGQILRVTNMSVRSRSERILMRISVIGRSNVTEHGGNVPVRSLINR